MNGSGYFKIDNWLFDEVMPNAGMATYKIVCAVVRQTAGWQKEWDKISISQFSKITGISGRKNIINAIEDGIKNGWIIRREAGQGFEYCFQVVTKSNQLVHQAGYEKLPVLVTKSNQKLVTKSNPQKNTINNKESTEPILDLVNHFADSAKVPRPNGTINRAKWLDPLIEIYHAAHDDYNQTCQLITDTVRFLTEKGYTIVTPKSILKTATSTELVQQSRGVSDV